MDRISSLHDDLLLKVLSFLPTDVAISTSILSKRWQFVWMWLPKLEYGFDHKLRSEWERLGSFINFNLPKHKAPVIESLRLKFRKAPVGVGSTIKPEDIENWVAIAVSRCVRKLSLSLFRYSTPYTKLPSSLFTCKSLVFLKLEDGIIMDVPHMVCLPRLKTLILGRVTYVDEKSLPQLLSNCSVLEYLFVEQSQFNHSRTLSVIAPSLQRLTLYDTNVGVINTPSLKYLKVVDCSYRSVSDMDDSVHMPKLNEADIDSSFHDIDMFFRTFRFVKRLFVKRLSLCLRVSNKEARYGDGIVFNQLEHLKLCSCHSNWSRVVVWLFKDSPNLRGLEVYVNHDHENTFEDPWLRWYKYNRDLDCVPQCLLGSLETFKWTGIKGWKGEIDLVKYILTNACCLKTATFLFGSSPHDPKAKFKSKMIQELSRCSTTCQLVFEDLNH